MSPEQVRITVEGRELTLSNLDKVLFSSGFTKRDLIDYYAHVAPAILRYLRSRLVTVKRFPDGTSHSGFIEKNVPRHAPDWIETVTMPRQQRGSADKSGSSTTTYVVVDGLPTLTWLANLAAVELHTPQWRIGAGGAPSRPDLIVFDLDPGAPASITECCAVALRLRERLARDRIELLAKTSGSKGLQCYGRIASRRWDPERPSEYAHDLAQALERDDPGLVLSRMTKAERRSRVFVDWSQNNPGKTTVTPYSLRASESPSVSTPVTWDEVEQGARGEMALRFGPDDVLERLEQHGDLFAPLLG